MKKEQPIPHKKDVLSLFRRKEFKTVRVVGYVATCTRHFSDGRQVMYNESEEFGMPRTCTNTNEYADTLSYARRMADVTHKKTGCKHKLTVTLNVS